MKNSFWCNQSMGTLTALYLEKTGQIQKVKKRKSVRSATPAEVHATWTRLHASYRKVYIRLYAKLMRRFYDVLGSNQLWPGLKRYVSQPAWHFNQSSQLLLSISVLIINMLLLFLNISPCWLKLRLWRLQAGHSWLEAEGWLLVACCVMALPSQILF